MCNPISWWLTLANDTPTLWISDKTDSHTEAAAEFGIKDDGLRQVAAGEFWPDPENPSHDLTTWKLIWDYAGRDRKPAWMTPELDDWLRRELEKRCAKYVHTASVGKMESCRAFLFLKATAEAYAATVRAYGSATVRASGSATVRAYDSATVRAYDSATVRASGSATVRASDSATVEAYGSATVRASGSATVRAYDSATVEAYGSATVRVYDSATVRAYGSATVEAYGSATVRASDSATVRATSRYACLIFRKVWDGSGYMPVWCPHNGDGKTYRCVPAGYEVVEPQAIHSPGVEPMDRANGTDR